MKKIVSKLSTLIIILGLIGATPTAFAADAIAEADSGTEAGPQWEYVDTSNTDTYFQCHNMVSINELIYMFGGYSNGSMTDKTIVYNPKTNEFHYASNMNMPRYKNGSVVYKGKIYVFGGFSTTENGYVIDTIEVFDPKTEEWSLLDSTLPAARSFDASAVVGDKIYLIGGQNNGNFLQSVEIYQPETDTWDTGSTIPMMSSEIACTVLQNKIYIFGGYSVYPNQPSNQVYCYDPATDSWTKAGTMPQGLLLLSVSSYANKAILIGGSTGNNRGVSNETYLYDPTSQQSSTGPKLNTPRFFHSSTVVGNTVYASYGYNSPPSSNVNEATTIEKLSLSQLIPVPPATSENLTVLLNTAETIQLSVSNDLADNAGLSWTSSDTSVAQVDENGKVTAIAPGICSIAAENTADAYQELIPVKVFDGDADQYRLAVNLKPKQTAKLHLTEDPASTTWSSHDTTVATVNNSGRVTAVSNGLVIIEGEADSKSQHIYVRVKL